MKPWLTTGRPRSAASEAIFIASVKPPQRVRSTWTTSILPTSMSCRNDFRSLSSSPAAIRNGGGGRELGVALVVVGQERLLEPEQVVLLERPGALDGGLGVVDEAGVDHQVEVGPEPGAGLADEGDVGLGVLAHRVPAELDGGEPLVGEPPGPLAGLGRASRRRGSWRRGAATGVNPPPSSFQTGRPERLALDVPEGQVDAAHRVDGDPPPAAVDVGPVHLVPEVLGPERVLADQDVRQPGRRRVRERPLDRSPWRPSGAESTSP